CALRGASALPPRPDRTESANTTKHPYTRRFTNLLAIARHMGQNRSVAALAVAVLLLAPVTVVAATPDTAAAAGPVPAQWIVKQHTELLGRVPTAAEWD